MDTKGQKMISGDFTPQARLAQHHKDVGLIQQLGDRTGAKLPLTAAHARLLELSIQRAKLSQREATLEEKEAQLERKQATLKENESIDSELEEKPGMLRKLKQHLNILSNRRDEEK